MGLIVGLTSDGSQKEIDGYDIVDFEGSTAGNRFILDRSTSTWYVFDGTEDRYVVLGYDPIEALVPQEEKISRSIFDFNSLVQNLLNTTSVSYGYSSIIDAVSYHNCGITAWEEESLAFNIWRANTESLMHDNIFSFTADGITLPDLAGFTGQTGYFDVGITSPSRPNLFS